MAEGGDGGARPETEVPGITRRTFIKTAAVVGGAAIGLGVGLGGRALDRMAERYRGENLTGSKMYEIDGNKVEVHWVESKPQSKKDQEVDPKKAVVAFAPWSWGAEMPIIKAGGQKIADGFGENTFTISTRTDKIGDDALLVEAKGATEFLKDPQVHQVAISEVNIIGHSEGAITATDLTTVLEENNSQIKVNGLALFEPVGMYSRSVLELGGRFFYNMVRAQKKEFEMAKKLPPKGGTLQFLLSLWQDFRAFGWRYLVAAVEEGKTMARPNPNLQRVKASVLVIASDRDNVSNHREYIPQTEVNQRLKKPMSDDQLKAWVEQKDSQVKDKWDRLPAEAQAKFSSKEEFINKYMKAYRKQEEMIRTGRARNQIFRESIVPQAEKAIIIVGTKPAAHHTGLTDTRFEEAISVARKFPHFSSPVKAAAQIDLARK